MENKIKLELTTQEAIELYKAIEMAGSLRLQLLNHGISIREQLVIALGPLEREAHQREYGCLICQGCGSHVLVPIQLVAHIRDCYGCVGLTEAFDIFKRMFVPDLILR